jgi:hypothetical protein
MRASFTMGLLLVAASAAADPVVGETSVDVPVGSTVSIDVGYARGLQCDDVTIVQAELRGVSPTSNRLFLKGLRRGATACRAGTIAGGPSVLVHVTVK